MPRMSSSTGSSRSGDESRCVRCLTWLDRAGRYCARCLKSQRLKLVFGTLAIAQVSTAGVMAMRSVKPQIFVPFTGSQLKAVATKSVPTGWVYYDVTDPLLEDVTHHARLIAKSVPSPANAPEAPGGTFGTLEVTVSRHYGQTILLSFPTVSKACGANVCQVSARFDRMAAHAMVYRDVSDENNTILMLVDDGKFLNFLPNARDLTIVASLGTDQDNVLNFNVAGFRMQTAARQDAVRAAAVRIGGGRG